MNPGDLVGWRYRKTREPVHRGTTVYSGTMRRDVPIDSCCLLVSLNIGRENVVASWLDRGTLYSAYVTDWTSASGRGLQGTIVPMTSLFGVELVLLAEAAVQAHPDPC